MRSLSAVLLGLMFAAAMRGDAVAQPDAEAAIRGALTTWMENFNTGRVGEVCDLFAPDLRYDFRGQPERGFREICEQLRRALNDPSRRYSYSLQIKEILVNGDLAVVRLLWRLTVVRSGETKAVTTEEPGLDVFRRQMDGTWKIIRYMAYET